MRVLVYRIIGVIVETASTQIFHLLARFLTFIFNEEHEVKEGATFQGNASIELPKLYIRRYHAR